MNAGYDVFISYSRKDYEIASKINDIIRDWGYNPYFDKLELKVGDSYAEKIMAAITSSRLIIVIYSEHLGKSTWNRKEVEYAYSKGKDILVLNLDTSCQTDEWFSFHLLKYQYIDISKDLDSAMPCLLKSLQNILTPKPKKVDCSVCVDSIEKPSESTQEKEPVKKRKWWRISIVLTFFITLIIGFFLFAYLNRGAPQCSPDYSFTDIDTCVVADEDLDGCCDTVACDSCVADSTVVDYSENDNELDTNVSFNDNDGSSYNDSEEINDREVYDNEEELNTDIPSVYEDNSSCENPVVAEEDYTYNDYGILFCILGILLVAGLYVRHYRHLKKIKNLKISSNIDTTAYIDGEELVQIKANDVFGAHLPKGEYIIDFRAANNEMPQKRFVHNVKTMTDVQTLCANFTVVSPDDYKTINCFIAGSKKLDRERDAILAEMMRMHNGWSKRKYTIFAKTYEDFPGKAHVGGQQKLYNAFIKDEADIVIFILDGQIGEKTREEFNLAMESFSKKNHPQIYVFARMGAESNSGLKEIREDFNKYEQYWIDYTDLRSLKLEFRSQLNDYLLDLYKIFQA